MPDFGPAGLSPTGRNRVLSDGTARNDMDRRRFLGLCGKVALLGALPVPALAGTSADLGATLADHRTLRLLNTHTGERLTSTYLENGRLVPDALAAINHILRDHRTGEVREIDPNLLDVMSALAGRLDSDEPFHIISGYRSPTTNEQLRHHGHGVAKHSYHLVGKAVDLSLPGISTADLRRAALAEHAGGVGYYPRSGFVHVDTGPVRTW